jgi:hypothetical protein
LNSVDLSEDGADAQGRPNLDNVRSQASKQALMSSIGI